MSRKWPDTLSAPNPEDVESLLAEFWLRLDDLPDLILRHEHLLSAECLDDVRKIVVRLMLALNGITRPDGTTHLNTYLSPRQRTVLHRTRYIPRIAQETWLGQAVALVVIYRWYAYQLVDKYYVPYPHAIEQRTLEHLSASLPNWPKTIVTD